MNLEIIPVQSNHSLREFIEFPFHLYKSSSIWVPPIKKQEYELLTPGKHPFWQNAQRQLYLAINNGKVLGRIAAIIDRKYNAYSGEKCGAFGFFECENNEEVATALLNTASAWLKNNEMSYMRGPLNPSTNYTCGVLVDGFKENPAVMMPWNPPFYPCLLEKWGLRKEQDLFAYIINRHDLNLSGWLKQEVERLKNEKRFTFRPSSKATLKQDIHTMLDIYQKAWAKNWGFSPLSNDEAQSHVAQLKDVIDPDFFVIFFHENIPAGGMVALPNLNPLLKRLNGSLGITAPWHLWRSKKEINESMRIILFGILPEYRLYGLPLLLLDYMLEKARSRPQLKTVEGSWILESNPAMNDLMEDFSASLAKRYRIYRREIGPC